MDQDRRVADESFRREIAERLKGLETVVEIMRADIGRHYQEMKKDIVDVKMDNLELHYSIYGGPKPSDIGLQERLRKQRWVERAFFTGIVALVAFLGHLISPLYDKAVTDWVFNSPSEKWKEEQKRKPRVIHKTYIIKHPAEQSGEDAP